MPTEKRITFRDEYGNVHDLGDWKTGDDGQSVKNQAALDEQIARSKAAANQANQQAQEKAEYYRQQGQYGGYDGGAQDMSRRGLASSDWAMGEAMRDRDAQAVESQILSDREAQTRYGDQSGAMQLHREAAMGQAPSEAAMLMQQGLDRSVAGQQSMMGSARGAAALAQAQGNAAGNVAAMQNQAFTSAGALRAQEMAQARGAYGDMSNQVRGQDQNRLGMGNQMSQFNAGLNDQYRLGMSQQGQGWYQGAQRPLEQQLGANMTREGYATSTENQRQLIAAGQAQANRDRSDRMNDRWIQAAGMGLQIVGGVAGGMLGGPAGATAGAAGGKAVAGAITPKQTGSYNTGIGRKDPGY